MNVVKSHRLLSFLVCILLHSGSCDGESERPYVTGKTSTVAHEIETNTRFVSNCDYLLSIVMMPNLRLIMLNYFLW